MSTSPRRAREEAREVEELARRAPLPRPRNPNTFLAGMLPSFEYFPVPQKRSRIQISREASRGAPPYTMDDQYLYKILDETPPSPLPETLPTTALDANDGFIHLSSAQQTPQTARLFFSGHNELFILKLRRQALDGNIEFLTDPKAGVENGCAHVYGSAKGLGRGNVVEVVKVVRMEGEEWQQAFAALGLRGKD